MKLRENTFVKMLASLLLTVALFFTFTGTVAGVYMLSREAYTEDYTATNDCERQLHQNARQVIDSDFRLQFAESNFVYQVIDENNREVQRNFGTEEILEGLSAHVYSDNFYVITSTDSEGNEYRYTSYYGLSDDSVKELESRYTILYGVRSGLPYDDTYANRAAQQRFMYKWLVSVWLMTGMLLLIAVFLASFCIAAAGHKAGREGIVLNGFDKIWLEVLLAAVFLAGVFVMVVGLDAILVVVLAAPLLLSIVLVPTMLSVARRAKAHTLWKSTLLYQLWRVLRLLIRHIHITVRVVGVMALYALVQIFVAVSLANGGGLAAWIWILLNIPIVVLAVLVISQYEIIRKATARMAEGELGQVVDENKVPFFVGIARNLNRSGNAIRIAVEEATRSERMKTELITNVSHDIKTPLTSIISYVGLLKAMPIENEREREYIDILDRKSRRLGQLMNDLVEASKVTAGAVSVNIEPINLGELVRQASAEFESRMEENDIQLMCHLPEEPIMVQADGRHMWRVLDNLFGNAVKYAMPGTRVYVDLTVVNASEVALLVKNISREPLNIAPNELMERFVRGDESRNTEGSGLGLSIARSLMELQHGTMDIRIDGDLFKVILGLRLAADVPAAPMVSMKPVEPGEEG